MTRQEFEAMAENWYQRTHRLREVWQNPDTPEAKKEKAMRLWWAMFQRMQKIFAVAMEINQPKPIPGLKSGGLAIVGTNPNE